MVSVIGGIFQPDTTSNSGTSGKLFEDNSEMYLSLFLAQLKNQDPTQPFDTAQMTEQMSNLNTAQQTIETNKNLETLIALNKSNQASNLATFINKEIEYLGDTFYNDTAKDETFTYLNGEDFEDANIEIRDADGNLVYKEPADKTKGSHKFTWDGKDANDVAMKAGNYTISVVTKDSTGTFDTSSVLIKGIVSGVDFTTGEEPIVFVGTGDSRVGVQLDRIASVLETGTSTPETEDDTTEDTNNETNA